MKKYLFPLLLLLTATTLSAQVSVNQDNSAPDSSAMLDVKSTNKGMLIPRMTTIQRDAIANPAGIGIDNNNNKYLTGRLYSHIGNHFSAGGEDVFIIKTNNDSIWTRVFGGTGNDAAQGIRTDGAGNSYATGYFEGTVDFGGFTLSSGGARDIFILKNMFGISSLGCK